jgi:uncharacterized C2H2 Zn-finger protein
MPIDFIGWLKSFDKTYDEEHSIKCPYCLELLYDGGNIDHLELDLPITYHGEDGEKEIECPKCSKTFLCEESVDRTWETRKREQREQGERK